MFQSLHLEISAPGQTRNSAICLNMFKAIDRKEREGCGKLTEGGAGLTERWQPMNTVRHAVAITLKLGFTDTTSGAKVRPANEPRTNERCSVQVQAQKRKRHTIAKGKILLLLLCQVFIHKPSFGPSSTLLRSRRRSQLSTEFSVNS